MQHLDNDMDDLIRRAAENYPLDTNSANWEKVKAALENRPGEKVSGRDKRRFLWLLLLLPFGWLCNQYVFNGVEYIGRMDGRSGNTVAEKSSGGPPSKDLQKNEPKITTQHLNKDAGIEGQPRESSNSVSKNSIQTPVVNTHAGIQDHMLKTSGNNYLFQVKGKSLERKNNPFTQEKESKADYNKIFNERDDLAVGEVHKTFNEVINPFLLRTLQGRSPDHLDTEASGHIMTNESAKENKVERKKKFYAGIMGGVDATSVKLQEFGDPGYSYGAIIGYDILPKLSIEAGFFIDKKFYYTKGEYFSTKHLYMPSYYKLQEVTGNCKMFEIPVTLKYNFSEKRSHSWFVTGGISSYFMEKEDYDYLVYNTQTNQEYSYNKTYNSSSSQFLSVIQFSGGYTKNIKGVADLRIEPYVKIPVKKAGTGEMPLLSTGIQIGLTRKLF